MTVKERSWVVYDAGNSAFVLVLVTALMPIYFKQSAASSLTAADSTALWGYANGFTSLVLAIVAPFLGAMADANNWKKRFFVCFLMLGIGSTLALAATPARFWTLLIIFFIPARLGWAGANVFYDSFLVDVTTPRRMDTISAHGYGWGYVGSVLPFLLVIWLLVSAGMQNGLNEGATRIGFVLVVGWWLLLSVPALRHLQQQVGDSVTKDGIGQLQRVRKTLSEMISNRSLRFFLLAYFFYIDGVNTIITMATAYGKDLGFGVALMIAVLLMIQLVAFPCTLLAGRLSRRYSARNLILAGVVLYGLITVMAFFLPDIESESHKRIVFWLIAGLIAAAMGGIQALSRSFFAGLTPKNKSAEYFGIFNMVGKFAAIGGPLLMAVVTQISGESRWGVLSLLLFFVTGGILLSRIHRSPSQAS